MHKKRIIIGADSNIGKALYKAHKEANLEVIGTNRNEESEHLYLNLEENVNSFNLPSSIDAAYICAAITGNKACENDIAKSNLVNVTNTINLCKKLLKLNIHIVFLSSDLADDKESTYGKQKSEVERFLRKKNATIVRLSKVSYSSKDIIGDWLQTLNQEKPIQAYSNYFFSPISMEFCISNLINEDIFSFNSISIKGSKPLSYFEAIIFLAKEKGYNLSLIKEQKLENSSKTIKTNDFGEKIYKEDSHEVLKKYYLSN